MSEVMKNLRRLTIFFLCGLGLCCQVGETKSTSVNRPPQVDQSKFALVSSLSKNGVERYGRWQADEEDAEIANLIYWVEKREGEKCLVIAEPTGRQVYELCAIGISKIYITRARRTLASELAVEFNEGGSDQFIQLLAYEKGKISELVRQEDDNSFGADFSIRAQFRTGVVSAAVPFELLLTPYGLASPVGKETRVFRYKDGKYRYFGEYDRKKVADFTEKLIVRK